MRILYLYSLFPNAILAFVLSKYDNILLFIPKYIVRFFSVLKRVTNTRFSSLTDVACVDFPERANRFEVVYPLLSYAFNTRLITKTYTDEVIPIQSSLFTYPSAGWSERETWDMFGVFFFGNPDLRRILTDYGFVGHPLRKDYPLSGYEELYYDKGDQGISKMFVEFTQEFRSYYFPRMW